MNTRGACILSATAVISAMIWASAILIANRYTIVEASNNTVGWKLDRLSGKSYGCENSQFGPFCIPAPNHPLVTQLGK